VANVSLFKQHVKWR